MRGWPRHDAPYPQPSGLSCRFAHAHFPISRAKSVQVVECARIVESDTFDVPKVASRVPVPDPAGVADTNNSVVAPTCAVCRNELRVLVDPVHLVAARAVFRPNTSPSVRTAALKIAVPLPAAGRLKVLRPLPLSVIVSEPPLRLKVSAWPDMKSKWSPLLTLTVPLMNPTGTLASLAGTETTNGLVVVAALHESFGFVSPYQFFQVFSCQIVPLRRQVR